MMKMFITWTGRGNVEGIRQTLVPTGLNILSKQKTYYSINRAVNKLVYSNNFKGCWLLTCINLLNRFTSVETRLT